MITIILLLSALLAVDSLSVQEEWNKFKDKYGKNYKNNTEENLRYGVFKQNLRTIMNHNDNYVAGLETYFMGVNQFSDMSTEEFGILLQLRKPTIPNISGLVEISSVFVPDSIDWRDKNAVLEPKNQGNFGSSSIFSATGALEGQNAIVNNKSIYLSGQQLHDCAPGSTESIEKAFDYVKNNGIESEDDYPYTDIENECKASSEKAILKITGYKSVTPNEESLKNATGTIGPISNLIYAAQLQFYAGGIFKRNNCYNDRNHLDHAVLTVGYGISPSEYWIIKNSWGVHWGENGYLRLARNADQCGVALAASYSYL